MGDSYKDLDPAVRLRIRRVVTTSAVWAGLLVVSTAIFLVSKPYLDKRREERSKQPGYHPLVTRKDLPSPSQKKMEGHQLELDPDLLKYLINLLEPACKHLLFDMDQCIALLKQTLATPPPHTTLRVNSLKYSSQYIMDYIQDDVIKFYRERGVAAPIIITHSDLNDVILISAVGPQVDIVPESKSVLVGSLCGLAVLRGADVYAPGIVGAPRDLVVGESVSVYLDIGDHCQRGLAVQYDGPRVFIGNGIALQNRLDWFSPSAKNSGVAVKMTCPLYVAPSLNSYELSDVLFSQNLPSILVSHVLSPQHNELVIDMCAAPGGKTTHLATLMRNKGILIALDKTSRKVSTLQHNIDRFHITNVHCYTYDATKSCSMTAQILPLPHRPPYSPNTFDKVLLDAPCSGLGQRPQFKYPLKLKQFKSYPVYQQMLLHQAVLLLKPGGTLLYSTCSLSPEENEMQVNWVLQTFDTIVLDTQTPYLGYPGLPGYGLDKDQCCKVQRFGPLKWFQSLGSSSDNNNDTIGFFIAKFVKIKVN